MKILAFIPARLESKRFPNKVIKSIYKIPMIEHVRRRAIMSGAFDDVYIVTNSKVIQKKLKKYNAKIILTKNKHFNGTSRVSEISKNYKFDYAFILFADEPFINPGKIFQCLKEIKNNKKVSVFNVVTNLKPGDVKSPVVVKTIQNNKGYITDYYRLSKKNIIKSKLKKSSGILIFKKELIDNYDSLNIEKREKKDKIEQFRLLENSKMIKKIIIFDLDGVLIDSLSNMEYAWKKSCDENNIKKSFKFYKKYIGLPFLEILKKLKIDKNYHPNIKRSYYLHSLNKIKSVKMSKYHANILKKLKERYILALFTSKNKKRAEEVLGPYKDLFKYKIYPSNKFLGKPNPQGLNKIIKLSKLKKKDAIYIGDTIYDHQCSKEANIDYLHANWGYHDIKNKKLIKVNNLDEINDYLENKISIKSIYVKNIYPSVNTKKELKNLLSLASKDKNEINILNKIKKIEY
jgi:3-deoxy-manno-octulosonate cytidylyltransferase (CMP-KDO synthetase)